ncbi:MAG: AAA family ATPase [Motiliproteus sp.]|nr:AAA family ATPase [Motiliproteus sp.]MCW9051478.1 AAA family ATPase [Motiliproteus sp.]
MKILACYSNKGGVGKTASSVNIAHAFANNGYRTLLCDLDPQGASGFYFRVKPSKKLVDDAFFQDSGRFLKSIRGSDFDNLDLVPANMTFRDFDVFLDRMKNSQSRLRKALKTVKGEYDVVVLDCPPNLSRLSESVFKAADHVLVPVIPTTLSERTFQQLNGFFEEQGFNRKKILPFFSMVQRSKKLHNFTMDKLRKEYKEFCKTTIPFSTDIEKMGIHRAPVSAFASSRVASKSYQSLYGELKKRVL